ncbi:MAG TPA: peptidoglycan DD-metalloendopeptidase family protein [Gaiellaceae bacterium]|nr:peptidoglycan DD-metalloendopeptidase family protein [Gaiellaceae bacterium]
MGRTTGIAAALAAAALAAPGLARAYCWPLRPFYATHPIRGGFDDPRLELKAGQAVGRFHFGVDIAAPDGTPVYAVKPGRVVVRADSVSVRRPNRREFGYWHILPVVANGSHVRLHQLLGYVQPGWGHVHFAESVAGNYRNPLRPGALQPYHDHTVPVVDAISVVPPADHTLQTVGGPVSGVVGLAVDAYDLPTIAPPPPWNVARLSPALVRWRLLTPDGDARPWRTAVDFRRTLPLPSLFWATYLPGIWQNKPHRPGDYRFWLTQTLNTAALEPGTWTVQVAASDLAGNTGTGSLSFVVAPRS